MIDKKFERNVFKMFISNILIVLSGVISGFILPNILGVTGYGYYKIFNLYTTYIVFCDLGLANGIYLLFGGYSFDTLPKEKFRLYFKVLCIIQLFFTIAFIMISISFMKGEYIFIFFMLGLFLIVNNISNYFEKISIAIGEFDALSFRNTLKSFMSLIIVLLLWLLKILNVNLVLYRAYVVLFFGVYLILSVQYCIFYKSISFGKSVSFKEERANIFKALKVGCMLLMADMIANLILTIDRQFVSILFDINIYSIYSFAYSMLKIIVIAISAISTVLYPSLKRMNKAEMKNSYTKTLIVIMIIAFNSQLAYYPLCIVVNYFLPNYIESLNIFRVLFPSITINIIISMIIINHYKALQKQNLYFVITSIVLAISVILNFLAYMVTHKPIGFSIASVITMVVWYLISDYYISREYNIRNFKELLFMMVNILGYYIISFEVQNYYCGFIFNTLFIIVICLIFYKNQTINLFFRRKKGI